MATLDAIVPAPDDGGAPWRVPALRSPPACGGKKRRSPPTTRQPDRFLLDRGDEALKKKHWVDAREYYRQVVDNYPQSPLRPDAKLGIGETYLGEGSTEALVLGANEFREFLTFYPPTPRPTWRSSVWRCATQKQMRAPERDQTETKESLKEYQVFFDRYPNSPLMPEVRKKWREARDRLSEASYRVAFTTTGQAGTRARWIVSGKCCKDDPEFTGRDGVYFYLADSSAEADKKRPRRPVLRAPADRICTERVRRGRKKASQALNTQ